MLPVFSASTFEDARMCKLLFTHCDKVTDSVDGPKLTSLQKKRIRIPGNMSDPVNVLGCLGECSHNDMHLRSSLIQSMKD